MEQRRVHQHGRAGREPVDDDLSGQFGGVEVGPGPLVGVFQVGAGQEHEVADGAVESAEVVQSVDHQQVGVGPIVGLVVVVPGFAPGHVPVAVAVQMMEDERGAQQFVEDPHQGLVREEPTVRGQFQLHERGRGLGAGGETGGDRTFAPTLVHPAVHLGGQAVDEVFGQEAGEDQIAGFHETFPLCGCRLYFLGKRVRQVIAPHSGAGGGPSDGCGSGRRGSVGNAVRRAR